ncbi:subtilase [Purpureocillium lavendulum]|uniref:Subtilase n=1 Tax=Purpureocillium lavendulum TaxID=1247861 RepID=A0AB34FUX0_9HYPO|nr:subtilase [Purpureocillium lavendulum]
MLTSLFLVAAPLAAALPPYVVDTHVVSNERRDLPVVNALAENPVDSSYIAVFNSTFSSDAIDSRVSAMSAMLKKRNLHKRDLNGNPLSTEVHRVTMGNWSCAHFHGDEATVREVNSADEVQYVEMDTWFKTTDAIMQTNAPPGLNRISHSQRGQAGYIFDEAAGQGITTYVVDTGCRTTHTEFEGRAVMAANFVNNVNTDENGHGSHVSGTVAGATFGVAKKSNVKCVKVLGADGSGQNSGILQGMQFVVQDVKKNGLQNKCVMNMSLGGGFSSALNSAVNAVVTEAGCFAAVAAGNEKQDASNTSPASAQNACTVGAVDNNDAAASFSNFGAPVKINGPGVKVTSVGIADDTAVKVLSGTSMASPHIAGLGAYLMSITNTTGPEMCNTILDLARRTGAQAKGFPARTSTLIANNGNLS